MDSRTFHFPWRPQPLEHPWQMFLLDVITGLAIVVWYGLVAVVWYSLLLADKFGFRSRTAHALAHVLKSRVVRFEDKRPAEAHQTV